MLFREKIMEDNFSLINKTNGKIPVLPFARLKNDILGKNYSLSIAFVDEKTSKKINSKYRNKNKPTNVLSFPLHLESGEIVLCPSIIKKEIKDRRKNIKKNFREYLGFLVIHGMLHLEGMDHGSTMEEKEEKYDQKYFYRNRRRNLHDKSDSGRIH